MQARHRSALKKGIILLTAVSVLVFYYLVNPTENDVGPTCLIKSYTGWLCWGCGGQRAFHELLHGNFEKAIQLNLLIYPVLILFVYIIFQELFVKNPSYPLIRKRRVSFSVLIFIMAFTIFRNLY